MPSVLWASIFNIHIGCTQMLLEYANKTYSDSYLLQLVWGSGREGCLGISSVKYIYPSVNF